MAEVEAQKQPDNFELLDDLDWVLQLDPDSLDILDGDLRLLDDSSFENRGHGDSDPSSLVAIPPGVEDIEQLLLNDEGDDGIVVLPNSEVEDDFFAGLLLDSSDAQSCETRASSDETPSPVVVQESKGSDTEEDHNTGDKETIDSSDPADDREDDPLSKKRKRQLRNRDSAMRSRERKKLYVRDLELKSKFLEAECKRLGHALSCCIAENQMLQHQLQARRAVDASVPKQESAALPLESLLLGSLFWLMSFVCLFLLPAANLIIPGRRMSGQLVRNLLHQVGQKAAEKRPENKVEVTKLQAVFGLAWTRRRWKSAKWRMKRTAGYLPSALWL